MDSSALVLFVDVYGFARFVEPVEVFAQPAQFMAAFRDLLRKHFHSGVRVEDMECGAMVVRELLPDGMTASQAVADFLATIKHVERDFVELVQEHAEQIKRPASLHLGWSIVRGMIRTDEATPEQGVIRICSRSPAEAA